MRPRLAGTPRRRSLAHLGLAAGVLVAFGTAFFFATNLTAVKRITHSGGAGDDQFGISVGIDGTRVIVGAHGDDVFGANTGAAYIFEQDAGGAGNWGQVKQLLPGDPGVNDQFGIGVDVDGDTAVVGAFADGSGDWGSAYVFERDFGGVGNWGQIRKLNVTGLSLSAWFGKYVAIDGDTIVVSAYPDDAGGLNGSGSVYIFYRNQGGADNWGLVKRLTSPTPAANGQFGVDVSIDGDTLLVAELGGRRVHFFERNSGGTDNWGNTRTITGGTGELFAWSADVGGDFAVVGAIAGTNPALLRNGAPTATGAAYILGRNQGGAGAWGVVKKILASDGAYNDQFGLSVAVAGDTVVVGAFAEDATGTDSGSAYYFSRNAGGPDNWGEVYKLIGNPNTAQHQMGKSVDTTPGTAIVGAPYNDLQTSTVPGYAYLFDTGGSAPPPPPTTVPGVPVLTSPTGGGISDTPTYTWEALSDATSYQIQIIQSGVASVYTGVHDSGICSGTTCSLGSPPVPALANGDHVWRVRAFNSLGAGDWSAFTSFNVTGAAPAIPTLTSPSGAISDTMPSYVFTGVSGATEYQLHLIKSGVGALWSALHDAAAVCSGTACSIPTPPVPTLTPGDYLWRVRARTAAGMGDWTAFTSFSVAGVTPGAATLSAPSGSISDTTPTYIWGEVSGATRYQLQIIQSGVASIYSALHDASICAAGTCSVASPPAPTLAAGANFVWRVRAFNDAGAGPWSAFTSFSLAGVTPSAPTLIGPSGAAGTTTPTYSWNESAGATRYQLHIIEVGVAAVHAGLYDASVVCAGGVCSVSSGPPTLNPSSSYVFRVRGFNAAGAGSWSSFMSFSTP